MNPAPPVTRIFMRDTLRAASVLRQGRKTPRPRRTSSTREGEAKHGRENTLSRENRSAQNHCTCGEPPHDVRMSSQNLRPRLGRADILPLAVILSLASAAQFSASADTLIFNKIVADTYHAP